VKCDYALSVQNTKTKQKNDREVKCFSVKTFISETSAQIWCFVGFYVPSCNGRLFIAAELKEK